MKTFIWRQSLKWGIKFVSELPLLSYLVVEEWPWLMFWRPTAVNYLSPWLWFGTSAIDLEDSMVSFFPCRRKKLRRNVLGFELCVSRENEFG